MAVFAILLLALIAGAAFLFPRHHRYVPQVNKARLTNPLLEYMKFKELRPFRDKIEALIAKLKKEGDADEVAIYFRSLSDGIWIGINEREAFCPASLLKVPVMMAYFKLAETNPAILTKKILYEIQDTGGYVAGIDQDEKGRIGKYFTIDQLIEMMIASSDNNADALLWKNTHQDLLVKTFLQLGINLKNVFAGQDFISLKNYVGIYRVLYNASYLNKEMSEKALRYLTEVRYKNAIVAGVPKGTVVAHKFGERFYTETGKKQLHDVGIIYYPNNPYLLGVMTRGKDYPSLEKAIREISALIYNEIDAQYKSGNNNDFVLSE